MIPHPEPCVKVRVGTDTIGRPIWHLPVACYVAKNLRESDGHWLWAVCGTNGYGYASVRGKSLLAHRLVYELMVGPIPEGFEVDHVCKNTLCANPAHLEAVLPRENKLRSDCGWAKAQRTGVCTLGLHLLPTPGPCRECRLISLRANAAKRNDRKREVRAQRRAAGDPRYLEEKRRAAERERRRREAS